MSDVRSHRSRRDSDSRNRRRSSPRPRNDYNNDNRNGFNYYRDREDSSRSSSRSFRKYEKKEVDSKAIERQQKELQAFANQHDPDALFEKLKESRLNKLRRSVDEKKMEQERLLLELSRISGDSSEMIKAMNHIGEEKENSDSESANGDTGMVSENTDTTEMEIVEIDMNSPTTSDENIEDEYPWYYGAPIQSQIFEAVRQAKNTIVTDFDGRPQKEFEADGIIRTFPVKKRELVEAVTFKKKGRLGGNEMTNNPRKINGNNHLEVLKQNETGVVIRRGATLSWVSKKMVSETTEISSSMILSSSTPQLTSLVEQAADNNECYEYSETKKCAAGLLCLYNHNGSGDHRLIKFCKKFMNGRCRNGDDCAEGSHTLLRHQMPVCDYFLRRLCHFPSDQCPFLHVKLADNAQNCVFFNRGKCQKKPPCSYCHRYLPSIIRERGKDVLETSAESSESTAASSTREEEAPHLEWYV